MQILVLLLELTSCYLVSNNKQWDKSLNATFFFLILTMSVHIYLIQQFLQNSAMNECYMHFMNFTIVWSYYGVLHFMSSHIFSDKYLI